MTTHLTSAERRPAARPLSTFVRKVVADAEPMSQNTDPDNLGFGWVYYTLVRNLRPDFVVAIGSRSGFMPFCAARAVQDNGSGTVIFIDPSYCGDGPPGWGGVGRWSDPAEVDARIASFGLAGWISHLRMTSEEAFPHVREIIGNARLGIVIIDGAHTYENSLQDFELYSSLMTEGFVLFHDSTHTCCDVPHTIETLRARGLPMVTIHREVGLTIVEICTPPAVAETWPYLVSRSNRGERLLPYAQRIVRHGDRVCEAYCGYSPLGSLLKGVTIVGWDRDLRVIRKLRTDLPEHRWEQIDERHLPFAELPEEIDVLLGLGLSRGHAPWDPQHVLDNIRYLLGRYYPRACLFEAAADYFDAAILDDLNGSLTKFGYSRQWGLIHTDLDSYPDRRILLGQRL